MGINECRHEASHAEEEINKRMLLSLNILKIKTQAYSQLLCLFAFNKQSKCHTNETNPNSHNKIDMVLYYVCRQSDESNIQHQFSKQKTEVSIARSR